MSERGVFALDRGWFDHPAFAPEPFTEREAWAWLISAAVWKVRTMRVGSRVVSLKRGQAAFSVRFLAERWQWSKSRVDRFLGRLENRDMIGTESGTGITVVTICNYDKYQRVSLPERDSSGTETGTQAGQQRDKEEDIEDIEVGSSDLFQRSSSPSCGRDATRTDGDKPAKPDQEFSEFWKAYPRREGRNPKQPALKKFKAACRSGSDPAQIITGARRYAAEMSSQGKTGTPYVAMATTWLHQQSWTDYTEPIVALPSGDDADLPLWCRNATPEFKRQYRETERAKKAANGKPPSQAP